MIEENSTKYEDLLKLNTVSDIVEISNKQTNENSNQEIEESIFKFKNVPKGKPKSGRIWKEQKMKFSSIKKTRAIHSSLEKKKKLREELKRAKELSKEIKAQKEAEKLAKKERRQENLKRAELNRKKSEIVQVITNTAKLKRMKKKQLRMIEKRDTLNKT